MKLKNIVLAVAGLAGVASVQAASQYTLMYKLPTGVVVSREGEGPSPGGPETPGSEPELGVRYFFPVVSSPALIPYTQSEVEIGFRTGTGEGAVKTGKFTFVEGYELPGASLISDNCSNRVFTKDNETCEIKFRGYTEEVVGSAPVKSISLLGSLPYTNANTSDYASTQLDALLVNPLKGALPGGEIYIPYNKPITDTVLKQHFEANNAAKLKFEDVEMYVGMGNMPWGLDFVNGAIQGTAMSPGQRALVYFGVSFGGNSAFVAHTLVVSDE